MAYGKAAGAGTGSTARNVFRVTFSQALSAIPVLEAWDDANYNATARQIFAGTSVSSAVNGSSVPLLYATATTSVTPSSAWKPTSAAAGGAMTNRIKGSTNFVNLSSAAIAAAGYVLFNIGLEVPSDATVPSTTSLQYVLAIRYQYTGATPVLTWEYNQVEGIPGGGTEATPVWSTITAGAVGDTIRFGDTSVTSANVFITRPTTGTVQSGSCWILAS